MSPSGGWNCYVAAYRQVSADLASRTFVLLGTSHWGRSEKFGLTTKSFLTSLGTVEVDVEMVDRVARGAVCGWLPWAGISSVWLL